MNLFIKNICLLVVTFFTVMIFSTVYAEENPKKIPLVPGEGDISLRDYCVVEPSEYDIPFHNVTIIIDKTSPLLAEQTEWIRDNIFLKELVEEYPPFTKFSVLFMDNKASQLQEFIFNKCRPKTGINNTDFFWDESTSKENSMFVSSIYNNFLKTYLSVGTNDLKSKDIASNTYIIETLMGLFETKKFRFSSKYYDKRTLIIVSDMMQHTDNISFYKECLKFLGSCTDYKKLIKRDKKMADYISMNKLLDTKNVEVKIFKLAFECETSDKHARSLINLWRDYFIDNGIQVSSNPQDWVTSQKFFDQNKNCS
tara:strand:+ start:80 stop:1012 length:933 start_codon:yes stop_codon:yes gene_type:complete